MRKYILCCMVFLVVFILYNPMLLYANGRDSDLDDYLFASCFADNTIISSGNDQQDYFTANEVDNKDKYYSQITWFIQPTSGLLVGPMDSAWPMTCNDQHNTGRSPYSTALVTGLEKWRFRCGGSDCGPVIDKEGNIYFADWTRFVISVAPNGTERWRYKITDNFVWSCTPALSEDGTLYVGAWDRRVHALNATTGKHLWSVNTGDFIDSSPVIADDGTIYTGNFNGEVWAFSPNGTTRWVYQTQGDNILGDIAIADDGTLYVGTKNGYLNAIYPNGTLRWKYKTGGPIYGTPSIGDDGLVYTYSWDDYLYAFYPNNGTLKWRTSFPLGEETNVAIATDGTLYYGGNDLWAFYPNGTLRWVFDPGPGHQIDKSCIAISAEGTLYFGTQINEVDGGDIVAVNPDGTLLWRKRIADAWVWSSPCIAEDGTIYICSQWDHGGYLHAFSPITSNSPPETPSIDGKKKVKVDWYKWWKFQAFDPDNNPINFYIDWGDGTEGWAGERASGELCYFYHTYTERGSYTIRAKVKDTLGEESGWATYAIRVPYSYELTLWTWLQNHFPILAKFIQLFV